MSFVSLSGLGVLAGLVGLAGLLFILQRLRIRYREQSVVTTLFWQQAVQEASARIFWQRFRHLPAYLLVLAICALIWLSLAEPRFDIGGDRERFVLLLDASATMAREDRYQSAVEQLQDDVKHLPLDRRQVVWLGERAKTVLLPGEYPLLLEKRLETLLPQAAPSSLERELRHLASVSRADQSTTVLIYGDTPLRQAVVDLLPASMKVVRATEKPEFMPGNSGITALGVAEAASGAWGRVDVLVRVEKDANQEAAPATPEITLDGEVLDGIRMTASSGGEVVLHDVPANGGLLVATVPDDVLSVDNIAQLRLPQRPIIQVQLSPSLEPELATILTLDQGIKVTEQNADVVIRRRGEDVGNAATPALEFVPLAEQEAAFMLVVSEGLDASAVQAEALQSLGLHQIDSTALADVARRPIAVSVETGGQRTLSVWQELLGSDYNFTRSRSFPLFMARSVRWLARSETWYPYAAAGRALGLSIEGTRTALFSQDGRALDTLGVPIVPMQAGQLLDNSGDPALSVSLLDALATTGRLPSGEPEFLTMFDGIFSSQLSPQALVTGLLLLALSLLTLEWYLFQRGRLP